MINDKAKFNRVKWLELEMGYHYDGKSDLMLNDEQPKHVYVGLEELEAEISEGTFRLAMRKKLDRARRLEKKP